jgi:zinc protease
MFKSYKLKNGLKVLLVESKKSPVVSVQMWVRTGSADEKGAEAGLSHFIEHLVFKGTDKYNVGEIASIVEGSGGELNAYTSFDQTVFYVTISSKFTDIALDCISQMMGHPKFDPTEIDNEREVVIEEIKRGEDSPGRKASQLLFSTVYKKHPYGIPVIGYAKNIKSVSAKKIQNYFNSRYVPENMFLIVAGDFENKDIKKKIEEKFADFKKFKVKKIKRTSEPKQTRPRLKFEKVDFQETKLQLAWPVPNIKHKDTAALDVLALILGQGDSSRLVKALRLEKALVNSIGASAFSPKDAGIFGISANMHHDNLKEALEKIANEIWSIQEFGITKSELEKAILNLENEQFYGIETVDGLSRQYGSLEFYFEDPSYFKKYIRQVRSLTVKDIQKTAKKYLKPETLTACGVAPVEPREVEAALKKWNYLKQENITVMAPIEDKSQAKVKFKHHKLNWGPQAKKSKVEKLKFKNGLTALLYQSSEAPVVSARIACLGGLREETAKDNGLTELTSRCWSTATDTFNEEQIARIMDENATYLGAFSGRNTIGLNGGCLSSHQELLAALLEDAFLNAKFEDEIVEREKQIMLQQIISKKDNPAQVCVTQFMEKIFMKHPYALDMMGTEESLKGIASSDLAKYHKRLINAKNAVAAVSGNFDRKFWVKALEFLDSKMGPAPALESQFKVHYPKEQIQTFTKLQREQSHLILGYPGLNLHDERRYVLQVMQSILAGQGGRLFIELRDKKSLAYSVSPLRMEGIDAGYFAVYIGCSPEKVSTALKMMKEELDKLAKSPVGEQELERAKRYIIGKHDIEIQRASSVGTAVLFDDIYGIDFNEIFLANEKIKKVTSADIQALAKSLFEQPEVISLVGPKPLE